MNTVLVSLGLMWKGMLAIFVVMFLILLVLLALSPRKRPGKD